jgi:two-component system cell cycle response regulator DivK
MAGELIVIIEDNEKNRKLARHILEHEGYRILEAEGGEEGVRLVKAHRASLVLMDIRLPDIDGIEALRRLRDDPVTSAIPVMAVTASAMTTDRFKIMAAGFDAYQSKPIALKPFVAAVRELIERAVGGRAG